MKPLNDYIITIKRELEVKHKSGLILQGSASNSPPVFEVIALPKNGLADFGIPSPDDIKVGDLLLTNGEKLTKATIDDVEYHFIKANTIIAVL